MLAQEGPLLHYVAAVTVCGLNAKLNDDHDDEHGLRRLLTAGAIKVLDAPMGRAIGDLHGMAFPVYEVRSALGAQDDAERTKGEITACAIPTARAFGFIYSHLARLTGAIEAASLLRRVGESLGLLVYCQDAWEDWAKDQKRGRFNPLHPFPDLEARRATVLPVINDAFSNLQAAFDALPLRRNRDLLSGMVIGGVSQRLAAVQANPEGKDQEPSKDKYDVKDKGNRGWHCCDCAECFCGPKCQWTRGEPSNCCDCNPCDGDCCGCDCA